MERTGHYTRDHVYSCINKALETKVDNPLNLLSYLKQIGRELSTAIEQGNISIRIARRYKSIVREFVDQSNVKDYWRNLVEEDIKPWWEKGERLKTT